MALCMFFLNMFATLAIAHNKVVVVPLGDEITTDPITIMVAEDAGSVTIPINRSGGSEEQITVMIQTVNGSAKHGQDYSGIPTPLSLTWIDGNTVPKTITFPINRDNLLEGDETFRLRITSTNPDWINSRSEVIVVIEDVAPGKIQIEFDSYSTLESTASVVLRLLRLGGDEGRIDIDVQTNDGTAKNGQDYSGIPTPLNIAWEAGNTNVRTISLPILNDSITEAVENFTLQITSTNPDWISTQNVATVSIRDSNIFTFNRGKIRVVPLLDSVLETAGTVTFELERFGGSFGTITAQVSTVDGSARTGRDYSGIPAPLTLTWTNGNTATRTITLPITRDALLEPKEHFFLVLSGGNVGFPSRARANIKDVPPGEIHFGE